MKLLRPDWPFSTSRCPVFYGWPVLAAGTLGVLMSVPGQTMGVSVFTDSLIEALSVSRSQLSFAYMMGTIMSAFLLSYAGRLCDRLGPRVTAAAAATFLALVLVLLSASDLAAGGVARISGLAGAGAAFAVVIPAFFGLRFSGQGVLTLASNNMIVSWFERRRGTVCGISGVFVALGFSIAPLVLDYGVRWFGWRGAWQVMAGFIAIVFVPLVLAFYRDDPRECGLKPDGEASSGEPSKPAREVHKDFTLRQARRTGLFWVFSLTFALCALYVTGLTFHIVSVFEIAGMSRATAVSTFIPVSVVAVLVHASSGWLSDRVALTRLLAVMLAGMAISMVGLLQLGPGWPVALLIVGNGISTGLFGLLNAISWAHYFGLRHLGAVSGLNLSIMVFHSALGPVVFSESLSRTGSYGAAGAIGALAVGALMAALFFVHRRYRAAQKQEARASVSP